MGENEDLLKLWDIKQKEPGHVQMSNMMAKKNAFRRVVKFTARLDKDTSHSASSQCPPRATNY